MCGSRSPGEGAAFAERLFVGRLPDGVVLAAEDIFPAETIPVRDAEAQSEHTRLLPNTDKIGIGRRAGGAPQSDAERLLAGVPEEQRALVRAVKLEGRSIADVSAATGLSPSAVKVKIHRAIKTLRRNM